uniref:Uncharacterized protein n=1 Tax=Arundo donax TaxID=35708 RepID=A0A0A9CF40_ARUDO
MTLTLKSNGPIPVLGHACTLCDGTYQTCQATSPSA